MRRSKRLVVPLLVLVLAVTPTSLLGWGTMTAPPALTKEEMDNLKILAEYSLKVESATSKEEGVKQFMAEFERRKGPHPLHQYIAVKAFQLLEQDPAYKDNKSGFPGINYINGWDGIYRGTRGQTKRGETNSTVRSELMSPGVSEHCGPGADAELYDNGISWNPDYDGASHYWSPWLRLGRAPDSAGAHFAQLIQSIAMGEREENRAKYAHYMAHYIGDVASAKHADGFAIPERTTRRLEALGKKFVERMPGLSRDVSVYLKAPEIAEAKGILRTVTDVAEGGAHSEYYWDTRVQNHISKNRQFAPRAGWRLDIHPPDLDSAVLAYIYGLATKPADKDLQSFYGWFDPFYFNGPIIGPDILALIRHPWSSKVLFDLCTPASEHLAWETNPLQGATANYSVDHLDSAVSQHRVLEKADVKEGDNYVPFTASADLVSADANARGKAYAAAVADLVKHCSSEAHGEITSEKDFDHSDYGFRPYMRTAIRHVFTAFRASITSLRADVKVTYHGSEQRAVISCKLSNLAAKPADLKRIELLGSPKIEGTVDPAPMQSLEGKTLAQGQTLEMQWEVRSADPNARYIVDLFGTVRETPDCGWYRATSRIGASLVEGVGGLAERTAGVADKTPLDVVFVLDVSRYMSGALGGIKSKAGRMLKDLKRRCPDLQVGFVFFTDARHGRLEVEDLAGSSDKPLGHWWDMKPLTPKLDDAIATLEGVQATQMGAKDGKCSALAGARMAIKNWEGEPNYLRKPCKIVVLITQNSMHDPEKTDAVLTKEIVAELAEAVDPAHIYPIVLGDNAQALADMTSLASLTGGKVFNTKNVDELPDLMLQATLTGLKEHPPLNLTWLFAGPLFWGGLVMIGLAGYWSVRRPRGGHVPAPAGVVPKSAAPVKPAASGAAFCTKCGGPLRQSATFCTRCGTPVARKP